MKAIPFLALLAGACGGGGGGGGPDGAPSDAATHGPVSVTVWASGSPAVDVPVMVHDPDGAFVRTVITDAGGVAAIDDFPDGGAVTAPVDAYGRPVTGYLTTLAGARIGDSLTIGKTPFGRSTQSAGTLEVDFGGTLADAAQYQARAGCNEGAVVAAGDPVLLSLRQVCVVDGSVDVVGYAVDAGGARIGYASATEIGIASPGAPLPDWQTDLATWPLSAASAPGAMGVEGFYQGFRRGIPVDEAADPGGDIAAAGSQAFDWRFAPGFFDESTVGIHARYGDGTVDRAAIATWAQRGATGEQSIDLAADLMPEVTEVQVAAGGRLGISYAAAGAMTCPQGGDADAAIWAVVGTSPPDVTTTWLILSPGDLASGATLPELDPDRADLWPAATFTDSDAGVLWIADSAAGYDDIRTSEANLAVAQYGPEAAGTRCMLRSGRFGASARP
ncbi:MAG TPA: hypothetical protein VL172_13495 [Kofleriaceae bacterium]|nr:hypothetical protein [Kofleriaceae bacterium]